MPSGHLGADVESTFGADVSKFIIPKVAMHSLQVKVLQLVATLVAIFRRVLVRKPRKKSSDRGRACGSTTPKSLCEMQKAPPPFKSVSLGFLDWSRVAAGQKTRSLCAACVHFRDFSG